MVASPLLAALAAAAAAYPFLEARSFRVRAHTVSVEADIGSLSVLHVSDLHLNARDSKLQSFLSSVPETVGTPDLALVTGDLVEDDSGIEPVVDLLSRIEAHLGRFYVLGSHDYYQAKAGGFSKYWTGRRHMNRSRPADTAALEEGLQAKGWVSLKNRTELVATPSGTIRIAGVDDPYIGLHETGHIERGRDEVLAIALVHAPDVVSQWALNGFDLILAGHTHGGQVRLPGVGALVTNCSLPTGLAMGLNRVGNSWLHVSPGLGTGRFTPIRLLCRPEVTLLNLSPRSDVT